MIYGRIKPGDRYGRLITIMEMDHNPGGDIKWLCKCDCGNEKVIMTSHMKSGHTQSCGCVRKEMLSKKSRKEEVGNKYGRLLVIASVESNRKMKWLCKCDCGNEKVVLGVNLRSGGSKSCGCLTLEATSLPEGEGAFNQLYKRYIEGARHRNIEWNLSKDQVRSITKKNCYYCGVEPKYEISTGKTKEGKIIGNGIYLYNGIDRVDSSLGYTEDNVLPCCGTCNVAKLNMSINEFKDWVSTVYNNILAGGKLDTS